jgi:hypothetical protein
MIGSTHYTLVCCTLRPVWLECIYTAHLRPVYLLIHVHVYEINKYEIKLLLIFAPDGSEATISPVRVGSMWSIVWEATA